jgi:hypothetical protein
MVLGLCLTPSLGSAFLSVDHTLSEALLQDGKVATINPNLVPILEITSMQKKDEEEEEEGGRRRGGRRRGRKKTSFALVTI